MLTVRFHTDGGPPLSERDRARFLYWVKYPGTWAEPVIVLTIMLLCVFVVIPVVVGCVLDGGPAAVGGQYGALDQARVVAGEVRDHGGDLLGRGGSARPLTRHLSGRRSRSAPCPVHAEPNGGGPPDPAGGAGDQGDPVGQLHERVSFRGLAEGGSARSGAAPAKGSRPGIPAPREPGFPLENGMSDPENAGHGG